jgi:hypothetical protein
LQLPVQFPPGNLVLAEPLGAVDAKLGVVVPNILTIQLNWLRRHRHFEYLMLCVSPYLNGARASPIGLVHGGSPGSLPPDDLGKHSLDRASRLLLFFFHSRYRILVLLLLSRGLLSLLFPFAYEEEPKDQSDNAARDKRANHNAGRLSGI